MKFYTKESMLIDFEKKLYFPKLPGKQPMYGCDKIKSGAPLAWVQGVRPNPSFFWHIQ